MPSPSLNHAEFLASIASSGNEFWSLTTCYVKRYLLLSVLNLTNFIFVDCPLVLVLHAQKKSVRSPFSRLFVVCNSFIMSPLICLLSKVNFPSLFSVSWHVSFSVLLVILIITLLWTLSNVNFSPTGIAKIWPFLPGLMTYQWPGYLLLVYCNLLLSALLFSHNCPLPSVHSAAVKLVFLACQ